MRNSDKTREKLLSAATEVFWDQGYSNTSLRQIARMADVDVALISRYFGGKLKLFEAALTAGLYWPELIDPDNDPIKVAIAKYTASSSEDHKFSITRMIVMNASDPQVGDMVRQTLFDTLVAPLESRMDGEHRAAHLAMFFSVIIGASVARHSLLMPGMAEVDADTHARQLRYLIDAALQFEISEEPKVP